MKQSRSNPNAPIYLMAITISTISFVVGAVLALVLYKVGGLTLATIGVASALITFTIGLHMLLSLRDRDGQEP